MTARLHLIIDRLAAPATIALGAVLLRLVCGVGFANYDTLYALVWGGQLARGQLPTYDAAVAPTPHPLAQLLGLALEPLPAHTIVSITVWLGYVALSGCAFLLYRLGSEWFGRLAGALAAVIMLSRVPILSYGARAYLDIPYLLLLLWALLVETRRRRAGLPVLLLLSAAGLLRPEAWFFSAAYWVYLLGWLPRPLRRRSQTYTPTRSPAQMVWLALLAASAPLIWIASDWLITSDPLWSLTNTRHTAATLGRVSGISNVPQYIPRRIGEILRVPVLVGGALGVALTLAVMRGRALLGLTTGVLAVVVFALLATLGLPINTRYAFFAAAILALFCGAGVFGWLALAPSDRWRPHWMIAGLAVGVAIAVYLPSQYRSADHELSNLARQQRIQKELIALVKSGAITLRCGPVEVTDHAPIPLLALYLKSDPKRIVSAQSTQISHGTFVDPANAEVQNDYILDPHDPPPRQVSIPPGFRASTTSRSWLIFTSC